MPYSCDEFTFTKVQNDKGSKGDLHLQEGHRYFLVVVDIFVTYFDFIKDRDNHCVFVSSFCYRLSHLFCFINRLMHAMIISSICVKQKDQCLSER